MCTAFFFCEQTDDKVEEDGIDSALAADSFILQEWQF